MTTDNAKDDATKTGNESGKDDAAHAGKETSTDDNAKGKTEGQDKSTEDTSALKKALKAERDARAAAEKQLRDAELAKLPELERYKSEAETLAKENEKLTTENMRMKIGMELELPWRLAKRIAGDTEDEMRSDAAEILKDFKRDEEGKTKTTKTPPNDGRKQGPTGKPDMNALMRAAAGRS